MAVHFLLHADSGIDKAAYRFTCRVVLIRTHREGAEAHVYDLDVICRPVRSSIEF
ncbi:MAG TPA: hypothetical protein VNA17_07750 [Pyrinomonadaceae bacterium]|nr:hypothetical protein [Pyrinomonadaceae bacterium]